MCVLQCRVFWVSGALAVGFREVEAAGLTTVTMMITTVILNDRNSRNI